MKATLLLLLACLAVSQAFFADWLQEPQWGAVNPGPRGAASMVHVDEKLVLFGGVVECFDEDDPSCDHVWFNDTYEYNLFTNKWSTSNPTVRPGNRGFMGADKHDASRSMIIFGGAEYNVTLSSLHWYDDMWQYKIDTNTWTQITYNNAGPGGRLGPQMQIKGDTLYVFGGVNVQFQVQGDFWKFDLVTRMWTLIAATSPPPPRFIFQFRMNHPTDSKIFVHGGNYIPGDGNQLDDSWVYDISDETWTNITGSFPGRTHAASGAVLDKFMVALGDINDDRENGTECASNQASKGQNPTDEVWAFDLVPTPTWTQRQPGNGPSPLKRIASTSVLSRLYIYGGFDFLCPENDSNVVEYKTDLWSISMLFPLFP